MKKKASPARSPKTPAKEIHLKAAGAPASATFPIVGIGASAGGLEALDQFLGRVPTGSGMAFVIVQHLDPTRKGIMSELLQRATGMKVIEVKDRTTVRPDCVYVIPPNKDMSLLHGVLHLLKPTATRGMRLPIDFFLRSLAQDQQEHSVGVILSGMGSDGTMGLRAIKEKAGVVLVQEPATAKFDSMPRSAIDAGLADIVARAEELPGKILAYLQRTPLMARTEEVLEDKAQSALEKVVILLRAHTGNDFSFYKRNTLYRRIERRMGIHQIKKMTAYVRYLQENSQELDLLFRELLIGVTNFFRDPAAWEQLSAEAIPALLASRPPGKALRAWVPGCSTGEEAYSLAIVFKEALEEVKPRGKFSIQIFATDLDRDAIEKARQGIFSANIAADISDATTEAILHQGRTRLPGAQRNPRDGDLCAAESHHGPAVHQAGYFELPQLADLSDHRGAEETDSAVSLQPFARRHFVSRQRGDGWGFHPSFCPVECQIAALPADGIRSATGADCFSLGFHRRTAGHFRGAAGNQPAGQSPSFGGSVGAAQLRPARRAHQ